MTRHTTRVVGAYVAVWLILPACSWAQLPAASFDELSKVVGPGQEVTVAYPDGRRMRGKVGSVTKSALVLNPLPRRLFRRQGVQQSIVESSVTTVTRMDSPLEGLLLGFAAGYVPTAIAGCALESGAGECTVAVYLGAPLVGFVGAAVGGLIDAKRNRVVYRAGTSHPVGRAAVALVPVLNTNSKGVVVRFQF